MLPPLTFEPILKRIRWGGRKLGTQLGKPIGPETDYAESWEIADHADGQSVVSSGPFSGRTLSSLLQSHQQELMGSAFTGTQFPLLIKFLDANDWLSLQVHPDDRLAKQFDPHENGKTEAWVILDAQRDSQICSGLKSGVTREQLAAALNAGPAAIEECLHIIPVKAGDCVFVPAGTVHALGPGILLAEVQQQSNLTFRLYDWGRVDSQGKPRPIHVQESLACTDFQRGPVNVVTTASVEHRNAMTEDLVRCPMFNIRRHSLCSSTTLALNDGFRIVIVLDGSVSISNNAGSIAAQTGNTVLVPASSEHFEIAPQGSTVLLEISLP
jgi:mannose-6-phosphate isomerase